ncbi:MFS transporter [Acidocella aminolytica]|uniref:Major facilitator superfamily transporter n=1 Tax=Acidocella aminolytica 101 = DSM 11237 TaxID=1120923 RepID=A0A0D6PHR9_9PROT|nr:MFS transporter [Acidocella aminolytica]GAN80926.1 major facilitator superfamily transporter [Acidocella aminolytica 101 = DSM 11237]GBQ34717.1 major facilitator superfamily transporter [Acidocella aminolytica 101 = DSM 11237]SHF10466.1 Predicted arabinose efflux permease, MFS family [Acidocella aminolytica 101 = DSM 11237]
MSETQRQAGNGQGILLLCGSCLPILGAVLLGPVLADVQTHFITSPDVATLTPVMLTIPALMIAVFSPLAGWLADRFGRRRLLLVGLLVYTLFGTAPLYLPSLQAIVLSRAGLGLTEAVVMTICTALIGDYFEGNRREFWLSMQGAVASFAAAVFFGLGGALGEFGWRTPFWLYVAGILMFPFALKLLWEPAKPHAFAVHLGEQKLPWRVLAVAYPFALVTGIALLMVPIQLSFILHGLGLDSPATAGLLSAGNQASVLAGALLFRLLVRFGYVPVFGGGFFAAGVGLLLVSVSKGQGGLLLGGCLNGLGCGLLLVGLITWALAALPAKVRGIGAGGFNACVFLGEFLSPLVILVLRHAGVSLVNALALCGWALVALILPGLFAPLANRVRTAAVPAAD